MSVLWSLIGGVLEGIVKALVGWLTDFLDRRAAVKQGEERQAAAETAQTVKTEQAIAQAEASAPKTIDDDIARAKAGTL